MQCDLECVTGPCYGPFLPESCSWSQLCTPGFFQSWYLSSGPKGIQTSPLRLVFLSKNPDSCSPCSFPSHPPQFKRFIIFKASQKSPQLLGIFFPKSFTGSLGTVSNCLYSCDPIKILLPLSILSLSLCTSSSKLPAMIFFFSSLTWPLRNK